MLLNAFRPQVMGILNVTPDSFFDGGQFCSVQMALSRASEMISQGATWIDIGAESSRPGSQEISVEEERLRLQEIVPELLKIQDLTLSVDTTKAAIADWALSCGARMINDISALHDPDMAAVIADAGCDVVLMHRQGKSLTMQNAPCYGDVVQDVAQALEERANCALSCGIKRDKIILDPGIGFGKTAAHNLQLLKDVKVLKQKGFRVLVGASRKSFLGDCLGRDAEDRLAGSLAVVAWSCAHDVDLVRVHDVKETVDLIKTWRAIEHA